MIKKYMNFKRPLLPRGNKKEQVYFCRDDEQEEWENENRRE